MLNSLAAISVAYVTLLFAVAFFAERAARRGKGNWLRAPIVYTLSLSIYCTAWTFYGAVGSAARNGFEYMTIYLGPSLVMIGWWWILRKLVRIGRAQRITSVADLISSRYGKSNLLGVGVTLLAVIGTTPYIALQLQSVTLSVEVFGHPGLPGTQGPTSTAFWVAAGLSVFTVIFGTRNLDANERHHGVVMAIALEAIVKLAALLAVGAFVVWGMSGGIAGTLERIDASELGQWNVQGGRWVGLMLLSAAAFLCLPRMFQVLVVENDNDRQLRMAAWAFPLYLMLMSLFIVPIAVVGLDVLPEGSNPDLFVLTVPLSQGQDGLAMLSFLGGFSSATSMVIVAAIALSTMVSNHIVMPIWLRFTTGTASVSGDVRHVVLLSRRISIAGVLLLGYLYYAMSGGGTALATIGLVSFTGVAQVLPALLGGVFWRGATRLGALAGISTGFVIWLLCAVPAQLRSRRCRSWRRSDAERSLSSWALGHRGAQGQRAIRDRRDGPALLHAVFWSSPGAEHHRLLCAVSIVQLSNPAGTAAKRPGSSMCSNIRLAARRGWTPRCRPQAEDLLMMAQRILGASRRPRRCFTTRRARTGARPGICPTPTPEFLHRLERELAGSASGLPPPMRWSAQIVGGSSSVLGGRPDAPLPTRPQQILEYSNQLESAIGRACPAPRVTAPRGQSEAYAKSRSKKTPSSARSATSCARQ